jgi:DNA-binding XRE family transcriptional regulator
MNDEPVGEDDGKLTRAELAKKLGISEAQLSYKEQHTPKPQNRKARRRQERFQKRLQKRKVKKQRNGARRIG